MEKIIINNWTTNTKAYVTEHVTLSLVTDNYVLDAEGKYKWQNRPWQGYPYCNALVQTLQALGASDDIITQVREMRDIVEAVEYLEEYLMILDAGYYVHWKMR